MINCRAACAWLGGPGHSTGRYGASTWYADAFGLDLARNCVAQMNIDSPGCRDATEYRGVTVMSEAHDFAARSVQDATGAGFTGERPHQAGDYSFNNIGISSLFMLLSSMPLERIDELGYYSVGGCGANIAWHTENDTLEIADKDNLLRDLRVYAASLQRLLNNPLHPYDFRKLTAEFKDTLDSYSTAAGADADFTPAYDALAGLDAALADLYGAAAGLADGAVGDAGVRDLQRRAAGAGARAGADQLHPARPLPQRASRARATPARSGAGAGPGGC